MKKNQKQDHDHQIEILKAVAQAWQSHPSGSKSTSIPEFDAHRRFFNGGRPSRFKIEATARVNSPNYRRGKYYCGGRRNWDFRQSLWDCYEIVSVSKKLETGLLMDDPFSGWSSDGRENGETKRMRESKNSLRRLFSRMSSSRRFTDACLASGGD